MATCDLKFHYCTTSSLRLSAIFSFTGKFTSPQPYHVITGLETLILLITDPESRLMAPRLPSECYHGIPPLTCPESDVDGKYRWGTGCVKSLDTSKLYIFIQFLLLKISKLFVSINNLQFNSLFSTLKVLIWKT